MHRLPLFLPYYFFWHYGRALSDFFRVFGNLVWAAVNFFSIRVLIKTLLAPWRRLREERQQPGFDLEEWFGDKIVNSLMRLVGFFVRSITILIGLTIILLILIIGVISFIIWLLMPAVLLTLLVLAFITFFGVL